MANNAKCIFLLLLTLCFSLQTYGRDSKFFSKLAKQNHESISVTPTMAPTLAPSPSPEAEEEHGYGLYGQDPFESYQYPPTTKNPTKVSGEKFVSNEDVSNFNNFKENGNNEKQGMSDTRFMENGKYYYDPKQDVKDESGSYFRNGNGNRNENRYQTERQGMSDTRFLENGKYFHDINNEEKNGHFNTNNFENENFEGVEEENNGHFNTNNFENENFEGVKEENNGHHFKANNFENENFEGVKEENNGHFNTNNFENENFEGVKEENNGHFNTNNYENENENDEDFEDEKQGMGDTNFLDNGKYYYDMNVEASKEGKNGRFQVHNYGNDNENENFEMEKHGLSDTRFLENGKYYYDVNDEKRNSNNNNNFNNNKKFGVEDVGFHSNNNVEFANTYHGNADKNEYETEARGGYNYHPNEYHVNEGRGGYNGVKPKKYVYDTMEEYDREQGYIDGQDHYIP